LVRKVHHPLQRLNVRRLVDRPLVTLLPTATIAEREERELGLRFLGTHRHAVADLPGLLLDLERVRTELVPRPGWRGDPGLLEEILVVEERSNRRQERYSVRLTVDFAVGGELRQEVLL